MCDRDNTSGRKLTGISFADFLHWPASLILLSSASLKAQQVAASAQLLNLDLMAWSGIIALLCVEILLASWLISSFKPKLARRATLIVFAMFLIVATGKYTDGAEDCGCFGDIVVSPIITMTIDILVISSLFIWPARKSKPKGATICWFGVTCLMAIALIFYSSSRAETTVLENMHSKVRDGQLIVVNEAIWHGKKLPILPFLIGDTCCLLRGKWRVVLFHKECTKCKKLISHLENSSEQIAFVQIPPGVSLGRENTDSKKWFLLSDRYEWFVSSPTSLRIENGRVVSNP